MPKRKKVKSLEKKQPPLFWQTEFLEKVVAALVVSVSAGALARLALAVGRAYGIL